MISPELQNGLFALAGAFVGSLAPAIVSWLNQRSEDRKHLREIASRMAIESWKLNFDVHKRVGPLEHQLVYSALIAEIATDKKLTPQRMKQRLDEIDAIMRVAVDHSYYLRDRARQEKE